MFVKKLNLITKATAWVVLVAFLTADLRYIHNGSSDTLAPHTAVPAQTPSNPAGISITPQKQRALINGLFASVSKEAEAAKKAAEEKPAAAPPSETENLERLLQSFYSAPQAARLLQLRDTSTAETLIPTHVPNDSYIRLQTRDLIQCMHELIANAQDTHFELFLRETLKLSPEDLRVKLKTIGRFGLGALQMFAELENENQAIVIETRKRGRAEKTTFIFYLHNGSIVFNSFSEDAAKNREAQFPCGTKITVLKHLPPEKLELRRQSIRKAFHLNTRSSIEMALENEERETVFDGDKYEYLNSQENPAVAKEVKPVRVLLRSSGYAVIDEGMGLDSEEIKEKLLTPKNPDKGVIYESPQQQIEEVRVYSTPPGKDPTSGRVGVWLNGRLIFEIPATGASVCSEAHFVFPHNASTTEGWINLEVDRVAIHSIKAMVDKLTDPQREIKNRAALIQSLVNLIDHLQPNRSHGAEEDLMEYLQKKVEQWLQTLGSGRLVVPNEKEWAQVVLPEQAILISPKLIPQTSRAFSGMTQLDSKAVTGLGLKETRIYLGSFAKTSTTSLLNGVDEQGKWILLDKEVWERNKENPKILMKRLSLVTWPPILAAADKKPENKLSTKIVPRISFIKKHRRTIAAAAAALLVAVLTYFYSGHWLRDENGDWLSPFGVSQASEVPEQTAEVAIVENPQPPPTQEPPSVIPAPEPQSTERTPEILPEALPPTPLPTTPDVSATPPPVSGNTQPQTPQATIPEPAITPHRHPIPSGPRPIRGFISGGLPPVIERVEPRDHRTFFGLYGQRNFRFSSRVVIEMSGDTNLISNIPFEAGTQNLGSIVSVSVPKEADERNLLGTIHFQLGSIYLSVFEGEGVQLLRPWNGVIDPQSIRVRDSSGREVNFEYYPERGLFLEKEGLVRIEWDAKIYSRISWQIPPEMSQLCPEETLRHFERIFDPLFQAETGQTIQALRNATERERLDAILTILSQNFYYRHFRGLGIGNIIFQRNIVIHHELEVGSSLDASENFYVLARCLGLNVLYHNAEVFENREGIYGFYSDVAQYAFCTVFIDREPIQIDPLAHLPRRRVISPQAEPTQPTPVPEPRITQVQLPQEPQVTPAPTTPPREPAQPLRPTPDMGETPTPEPQSTPTLTPTRQIEEPVEPLPGHGAVSPPTPPIPYPVQINSSHFTRVTIHRAPQDPSQYFQSFLGANVGWNSQTDFVDLPAQETRPEMIVIEGDTHLLDGLPFIINNFDFLNANGKLESKSSMLQTPHPEIEGRAPLGVLRLRTPNFISVPEGGQAVSLLTPWNGVVDPQTIRVLDSQGNPVSFLYAGENRNLIAVQQTGEVKIEWDVRIYSDLDWGGFRENSLPDQEKEDFQSVFGPIFQDAAGKTIEQLRNAPERERLDAVFRVMGRCFRYNAGDSYLYNGQSWSSTYASVRDPDGKMNLVCNGTAVYFFIFAESLGLETLYHTAEIPEGTRFYGDRAGHTFCSVRVAGRWYPIETTALVEYVPSSPTVVSIPVFLALKNDLLWVFLSLFTALTFTWMGIRWVLKESGQKVRGYNPFRDCYEIAKLEKKEFLKGKKEFIFNFLLIPICLVAILVSVGTYIVNLFDAAAVYYFSLFLKFLLGFFILYHVIVKLKSLLPKSTYEMIASLFSWIRNLYRSHHPTMQLGNPLIAVNKKISRQKPALQKGVYLRGELLYPLGWREGVEKTFQCGPYSYFFTGSGGFWHNLGLKRGRKLIQVGPHGQWRDIGKEIFGNVLIRKIKFAQKGEFFYAQGTYGGGRVFSAPLPFILLINTEGKVSRIDEETGLSSDRICYEIPDGKKGTYFLFYSTHGKARDFVYVDAEGNPHWLDSKLLKEGEPCVKNMGWFEDGSRYLYYRIGETDRVGLIYADEGGEIQHLEHLFLEEDEKIEGVGRSSRLGESLLLDAKTSLGNKEFLIHKNSWARRIDVDFPNQGDKLSRFLKIKGGEKESLFAAVVQNGDSKRWILGRINKQGKLETQEIEGSNEIPVESEATLVKEDILLFKHGDFQRSGCLLKSGVIKLSQPLAETGPTEVQKQSPPPREVPSASLVFSLQSGERVDGSLTTEIDGKAFVQLDVLTKKGRREIRFYRDGKPYTLVDAEVDRWKNLMKWLRVRRILRREERFARFHFYPPGLFSIRNWSPFHLATQYEVDRHDIPEGVLEELEKRWKERRYNLGFFTLATKILISRVENPLEILNKFEALPLELQNKILTHLSQENFLKALADESHFAEISEEGQIYARILQGHHEYCLLTEDEFKNQPHLRGIVTSAPQSELPECSLAELVLAGNRKNVKPRIPLDSLNPLKEKMRKLKRVMERARAASKMLTTQEARLRKTVTNQDKKGRLYVREWIQNARDALLEERARTQGVATPVIDVRSYLREVGGVKEWIVSVSDSVGMDLERIVRYLLTPDATTKKVKESDGFFGQGFFTCFTDCSEIRVRTGDGKKVYEIRLQPRYDENENLEGIRVLSFKEFSGNYKGSVIERVQYIREPGANGNGGVRTLTLAQAMMEHAYTRGILIRHCGAVQDVRLTWCGNPVNEKIRVLASEGDILLQQGSYEIERVCINGLFVEEIADVYLGSPDIPSWLKQWVHNRRMILNFPKGTLPIRARTKLKNPSDYQENIQNLLFKWVLQEYWQGTLRIPGLPDVETFLNRYDLYGSREMSKELEALLSFRPNEKTPTLWEEQKRREMKRREEEPRRKDALEINVAHADDAVLTGLVEAVEILYWEILGEELKGKTLILRMNAAQLRHRIQALREFVESGAPMQELALDMVDLVAEGADAKKRQLDRLLLSKSLWAQMRQRIQQKLGSASSAHFKAWFDHLEKNPNHWWVIRLQNEDRFPEDYPTLEELLRGNGLAARSRLREALEGCRSPWEREELRAWYHGQIKEPLPSGVLPVVSSQQPPISQPSSVDVSV